MNELAQEAEDIAYIDARTEAIEARWEERGITVRRSRRKTERAQMLHDLMVLCVYALLFMAAMWVAASLTGAVEDHSNEAMWEHVEEER